MHVRPRMPRVNEIGNAAERHVVIVDQPVDGLGRFVSDMTSHIDVVLAVRLSDQVLGEDFRRVVDPGLNTQ